MTRSNRIFAILGILAGIILVQACGRPLPPEESCNFVQNSQGQRVSWGPDVPVDLHLDKSVPTEFEPAVRSAIDAWNKKYGRTLLRYRGYTGAGSDAPAKDGFSKIYFMNTWDENKTSEQARTTVFWTGSRIYEADIRVNAKNFTFFTSDVSIMANGVHLESLLIHEFGHALGLAHNESEASVMRASLAYGYIRTDLKDTDLSSLSCEYR